MAFIELNNVWQQYGDSVVLERLNLKLEAREFCVVVGASGCGKSTFLRLLLGEEQPTRGTLTLGGVPLRNEPDATRGVVFQRYSVFPHLNVWDNVLLGLELKSSRLSGRLFGSQRRAARVRALEMLDAVGLATARTRYPGELSGGMQQRLALAQTLIAQPRLLLLDEPFGALDPGIKSDMHRLVRELWRQYQLTVVMVTHDLKEGFELGTRLIVFDKVRHDPHAPHAYGARVTYDLPLQRNARAGAAPIMADSNSALLEAVR
jgi:NitT/TauT family transport system ATP-binding protein